MPRQRLLTLVGIWLFLAATAFGAGGQERQQQIPAAPLPEASDALVLPTLEDTSVEWTTRSGGAVGYTWSARVNNETDLLIISIVHIILYDSADNGIHRDQYEVPIAPGGFRSFDKDGQIDESIALQADHWGFEVEARPFEQPEKPITTTESPSPAGGRDPNAVAAVLAVQQNLNSRGYDVGEPDGVIGPRTRDALRRFQADENLPVTGEINPPTRAALGGVTPQHARPDAPRNDAVPPTSEPWTLGPWAYTRFEGAFGEEITIVKKSSGQFISISKFRDGSSGEWNLREVSTSQGERQRFMLVGSPTGDGLAIRSDGRLSVFDREGVIATADRVR